MKLENFEIDPSSIELQTGSSFWDLHNGFSFSGLELIPGENAVVLRWNSRRGSNRSGILDVKLSEMSLRFRNLQFLHVGARDGDLPLTEDTCISYILKADPNIVHVDPYRRAPRDWKPGDSFRLVFAFQSRRIIEIESETVELVALS
jgi:hypothetical protein